MSLCAHALGVLENSPLRGSLLNSPPRLADNKSSLPPAFDSYAPSASQSSAERSDRPTVADGRVGWIRQPRPASLRSPFRRAAGTAQHRGTCLATSA